LPLVRHWPRARPNAIPRWEKLGIAVQTFLLMTDDPAAAAAALQGVRHHVALYVGGMGAPGKNFYNSLFARYGYAAAAESIQRLYLEGKKKTRRPPCLTTSSGRWH
jgi:hypothetical protein